MLVYSNLLANISAISSSVNLSNSSLEQLMMLTKSTENMPFICINVEFLKNLPVHIPVPKNKHYNKQKAELIDNCILELRQTIKNKEYDEVLRQELAFLN